MGTTCVQWMNKWVIDEWHQSLVCWSQLLLWKALSLTVEGKPQSDWVSKWRRLVWHLGDQPRCPASMGSRWVLCREPHSCPTEEPIWVLGSFSSMSRHSSHHPARSPGSEGLWCAYTSSGYVCRTTHPQCKNTSLICCNHHRDISSHMTVGIH